jgi:hypothetical protein
MGMRPMSLLLLALLVLPLAGCPSKPVLELHGARLQSATPMGIGMTLIMRVHNDNVFDVKVRNVRVSTIIGRRYQLPMIRYNPDIWLPAGRSTQVPVPVVIPWHLVGPLIATTAGSSYVDYRVKGVVDVTAIRLLNIQRNDFEIDDEGRLSRMQLVAAAGRGVGFPLPRMR